MPGMAAKRLVHVVRNVWTLTLTGYLVVICGVLIWVRQQSSSIRSGAMCDFRVEVRVSRV